MATTVVNGVALHVQVFGDVGPVILGIHGTPSSSRLWTGAAETLSAVGRYAVYDRRGFPPSGPEPAPETLDLAEHVADAAALIGALSPEEPAAVIGRSTGGLIALALALTVPDRLRCLVLLEPAVVTADAQARLWATALRHAVLLAVSSAGLAAGEAVVREALGNDQWDALPSDVQQLLAEASPAVLAEMHGSGLDLSPSPWAPDAADLARIAVPTLLVSAEQSPAPLRRICDRLAEGLPMGEHLVVTGGHLIDPADPGVLDFIRRAVND